MYWFRKFVNALTMHHYLKKRMSKHGIQQGHRSKAMTFKVFTITDAHTDINLHTAEVTLKPSILEDDP